MIMMVMIAVKQVTTPDDNGGNDEFYHQRSDDNDDEDDESHRLPSLLVDGVVNVTRSAGLQMVLSRYRHQLASLASSSSS